MAGDERTIRDEAVVRHAVLADGRTVVVRVLEPDDPYVARDDLDLVVVELVCDGELLGVVETPLSVEELVEATLLAERIRLGLESGALEPSAGGIAAVASTPPA